jgi:hypothetical protein
MVVSYHLLRNAGQYVELGDDYYDQKHKPKVVRRLLQRLNRLGYYKELTPVGAEAPDGVSFVAATCVCRTGTKEESTSEVFVGSSRDVEQLLMGEHAIEL